MDLESFRIYCLSKTGVTESFPFDETTLVFKVMGKIFAITGLDNEVFEVNLKCDPELAEEYRETHEEVKPGFHMNKKHWNTVNFEQTLTNKFKADLIDHSYDLIVSKLPRKVKEEWQELNKDAE